MQYKEAKGGIRAIPSHLSRSGEDLILLLVKVRKTELKMCGFGRVYKCVKGPGYNTEALEPGFWNQIF